MRTADEADRGRLLELLQQLSYAEREVTLSSGEKSNFYIDCKQTVLTGEGHALVGRLFFRQLVARERAGGPLYAACGGLTMGADPLASALSLTAYLSGRELPAIYVRKEPKGHGTGAYLEGTATVPAQARVVVVEDVVTTGGASQKAIERLRAHGYTVDAVLALVDRGAGGRAALAALGVELFSLYAVSDFAVPSVRPSR